MLICQLQLKMKSGVHTHFDSLFTSYQFTIYHLPFHVWYRLHTRLDASEYAQFGVNYTLNYFA